ncbi:MAG TPA: efflux RND transporter permease subunit [Candidatus Dormibacteraeota bacterium]|nr:efflux RND transporter permease subunit [Candidatus Dormibacteraeota bacterium]
MNITGPFIRRPIMTTLVMASIIIFGVISYRSLAVSDLPSVDYPTINVSANLPGANPDTMAAAVATPLEKEFSTIAGIDSMTSTSYTGSTSITLQFDLSRNIDSAAQDVQAAISRVQGQLPPNMPSPPTFEKTNPADQAILYLALSSATVSPQVVDQYAETILGERISMVSGVSQVNIFGSQKYAVRIQLDPSAMAAWHVGIDDVATAVQNANVNLPTGTLYGAHKAYTVQASGQLMRAALYRPLIVAYKNGAPIRLDEIGNVVDSVQNDKVVGWYNTEHAVILAVQRQPGTNTVNVVDGVMKILPQFRAILPPSIHLVTVYDRSEGIRESVSDVKFTLFVAICMVVMVIFLFLRNLSATVIPSIALPVSLIGTFAVMYLLNYTVDNLSMMAMTLSVGFVVDDAIVMLENIVRHMEMGESPMNAALKGSREIGFTIVSMTLSLTAVFIPVLFMSGIIGRLLHEFAVVIMVAVLVSGLVSLTLTPMLCSRFLRSQHEVKHGRVYMKLENFFDWLLRKYDVSLQWALRHRAVVMVFSGVILVITIWQFMVIPKGFLPEVDQSTLQGATLAAQGISFDSMVAHQKAINKIVNADPNRKGFFSTVGLTGGAGNSGFVFIHLKSPEDRPEIPSQTMLALDKKYGGVPVVGAILRDATPYFAHHPGIDEVIQELRAKLMVIPGIQVFLRNPPPIQIGGNVTNSQYQFALQSPDTEQLYQVATQFEQQMQSLPGIQDVTSDLQIANPQVNVNIDRDKASALGVTAAQVEDALYTAYGQRQVSTIYAPNDEYWVIMQLEDKYQKDPNALSMLYIRSSSGNLVPLSAVAKLTTSLGPLSVNHLGQLPAVTLSFNLKPGTVIGQAVDSIDNLARTLPDTISYQFEGTAQAFQSSLTGLGILLLIAILVIYIVLGILYESFIHPITILSGLPSAAFGALLTLQIFGLSLDLYGFVGVIMLIGIVKKNAIMMVDFAIQREREEHKPAAQAAYEGSLVRFRPIMMTTMAALFGTLPIAIGSGAGAESRRPLGLAVCGGLIFSQMVTLYLTPVFYTYMDSLQTWLERRFGRIVGLSKPRFADESVSAD